MLRLPSFTYRQPTTLREALAMKADAGPEGSYVAGGTDLYPNMKRRHQEPKTVISLMEVPELRADGRMDGSTDGMTIGSCITLTELSAHPTIRQSAPAVAEAAELVSTPLLRNMGTLGGNLCLDTRCNYYNQSYEWRKAIDFCMKKDGAICWVAPSSATLLGGELVGRGAGDGGDRRRVRARGPGWRARGAGRAVLQQRRHQLPHQAARRDPHAVRLPAPDGWDAVYHKLRRRGSFDFPVLGVAAWVKWDGKKEAADEGRVVDARIVLGGVASHPQEVVEAGAALTGSTLSDDAIAAAAEAAFRPSKPMDNTDFDLSWRKQMTRVYVTRALEELRRRRK